MNQNDFRQILEKGKGEKKKPAPKPQVSKEDQARKKEKKKRSYQAYLKRKEKYVKKETDPNYRDRAKERQQGKLLDYADTEDVLKNISVEHSKVRCWFQTTTPRAPMHLVEPRARQKSEIDCFTAFFCSSLAVTKRARI